MKLHCFHGFLGSSRDFATFQNTVVHDLYRLCEKAKDDTLTILDQEIPAGSMLLGYSFGGRLAMQLFLKNPDKYKKLYVLSAHGGLKDKAAKMQRVLFDQKCADKLRELSEEEFLSGWNSQALFSADEPIQSFPIKDKNVLARFFTEYGLSTQDYLLDELLAHKDKLHFFYGESDSKYVDYAKNIQNMGFQTSIIKNAGHRLLQSHSVEIRDIMRQNV